MDIGPGDIVRVYDSIYENLDKKRYGIGPSNSDKEVDYLVVDGPNHDGYYHAWRLGSDDVYPAIKWDSSCIKEINPCS